MNLFHETGKLLTILISSIFVAVVLGTVFSLVYPRVQVAFGLASLFALAGLLIVLATRGVWKAIQRKKV